MKINYAVMSSDSNRLYLDFWPYVSKIWKLKLGIDPILIYIDNVDSEIDETYGKVHRIPPVPNYPLYIQNLFARYWFVQKFSDKVSIITDIDMFPMSKNYFIDQIRDYADDKYLHINPCIDSYEMIPSCYHIATGTTYQRILEIPSEFNAALSLLNNYVNNRLPDKPYWFTDEMYSSSRLTNSSCHKNDIIFIPREGGQNGHRIDRCKWQYDESLIKQDYYFDCHSARPICDYKADIEKIVSLTLGEA